MKGNCILIILIISMVLSSCQFNVQPNSEQMAAQVSTDKQDSNEALTSNLSKTYKRIINLQLDYAQKGVETVQEYIEIPNNARSVDETPIDFADIGAYLPDDLTSLKRIKKGSARSLTGDSAEEEISLEEELNVLANQFSAEFQDALPDPEKALTLPFVTGTDEGLLIGDDSLIPYNSIQGAITVEVLNALANGEDVHQLLVNFEHEVKELLGDDDNQSISFIKYDTVTWSRGVLNYRWGIISESHKTAVKNAMTTWNIATGGKVSFNELSDSGWNNFQLDIYAIGVIKIYDDDIGTDGKATVGYYSGTTPYLKIKRTLNDTDRLQRVPLHELGHCLGLKHEHQRYDRDSYIVVTKEGSNYEKIPQVLQEFRVYWARIRIGFWTISIPVGCGYSYQPNSYVVGPFDFDSIMLYDGFSLRQNPSVETNYNTKLSNYDIEAVKRLY